MAQFTMTWKVVKNDFPKIISGMEAKAETFVAKAALDIEAHAKGAAPVDTGTLKNSIQATRVGPAHWRVVVGADYGMYVEWGTGKMAAQPFLQPAILAVTLTPEEWSATQDLLRTVMHQVLETHQPDGWNVGWNVGQVGGQIMDHAHCHLVPRYRDERYAGKGLRWWFKQPENALPSERRHG